MHRDLNLYWFGCDFLIGLVRVSGHHNETEKSAMKVLSMYAQSFDYQIVHHYEVHAWSVSFICGTANEESATIRLFASARGFKVRQPRCLTLVILAVASHSSQHACTFTLSHCKHRNRLLTCIVMRQWV